MAIRNAVSPNFQSFIPIVIIHPANKFQKICCNSRFSHHVCQGAAGHDFWAGRRMGNDAGAEAAAASRVGRHYLPRTFPRRSPEPRQIRWPIPNGNCRRWIRKPQPSRSQSVPYTCLPRKTQSWQVPRSCSTEAADNIRTSCPSPSPGSKGSAFDFLTRNIL